MQALHMTQKSKDSHAGLRTALAMALGVSALFSSVDVFACAACGCTLSTEWAGQGIGATPGFVTDVSYTYLDQNTLIYGSGKASSALINNLYNNGQEIETSTKTQTVTASLTYNSDTWGVSLQVPYLNRTHDTDGQIAAGTQATNPLGSGLTTSSGNGLGDIRVIGRYAGFSEAKTSGLIAGIKFPTGSTNANFNGGVGAGSPLDPGLQIGTGSTDIIYGAYTSGLISTYGWFVQGTVQHAVKTANDMLGNSYRPGDSYLLNSGIRYAAFGAKVTPMLQLNIARKQADTGLDIPTDVLTGAPVSGGTLVYLAPGASVRVGGGVSVYGFVQLPIYQNVSSLQLVPKYILTIGARESF